MESWYARHRLVQYSPHQYHPSIPDIALIEILEAKYLQQRDVKIPQASTLSKHHGDCTQTWAHSNLVPNHPGCYLQLVSPGSGSVLHLRAQRSPEMA